MAKTRTDLAERALTKLLVVGEDEAPSASDLVIADGAIEGMNEDLNARKVFFIQDYSDIDLSAFEWLARVLADTIASDFGKAENPQMREYAENKLSAISAGVPSHEPLKTDYF